GNLRVGEAERGAGLLRGLRRERLDPAERQALAIGGWRRQPVGGCLRRVGERLDVDHLGAEVLERGARFEVAELRVVRCLALGAAMGPASPAPWIVGVSAPAGRYVSRVLAPTAVIDPWIEKSGP